MTPRKLTRPLGAETVNEISRTVIAKAARETRFRARAVRIDSTVIGADVRYAKHAGLARDATKALPRQVVRASGLIGDRAV